MPQEAIPRELPHPRRRKIRNWTIIGVLLVAAASGPLAMLVATSASSDVDDLRAAVAELDEAQHRAFAEAAAARWAWGGEPLPTTHDDFADYGRPPVDEAALEELDLTKDDLVDGRAPLRVQHLAWDDAEVVTYDGGEVVEIHRFVVAAEEGLLRLSVPVAEGAAHDGFGEPPPALAGDPAVVPYEADQRLAEARPVSLGSDSGQVPDTVVTRVEEWADAFAGNDQRALYNIVSDDQPTAYVGLPDVEVDSVEVGGAVTRDDGLMAVEVDLTMSAPEGVVFASSYDVLVARPNEPLPAIVAWGPRGSAPTLQPYENALPEGSRSLPAVPTPDTDEREPR